MNLYEKVNPSHPDKIADRIAGAIVDAAYKRAKNPKIAVEVLLGHGVCQIIAETSVHFSVNEIGAIQSRICGGSLLMPLPSQQKTSGEKDITINTSNLIYREVPQDSFLAENQSGKIRCGDNGIFLGVPLSDQEKRLSRFARELYKSFPTDGKFMIEKVTENQDNYYICQSCASAENLRKSAEKLIRKTDHIAALNPLGEWTGGLDVDSGATNRKLGSDLGQAVTGGGLHGKDLSKSDVALTIYAHLQAQKLDHPVEYLCAIGDETVDGKPYAEIVQIAKDYIDNLGGFENLAAWGLV